MVAWVGTGTWVTACKSTYLCLSVDCCDRRMVPGPPTGIVRGYSGFLPGCQQFSIFIFASDGSLLGLLLLWRV